MGVLLEGEEDEEINEWFIETAFPSREEVRAILSELERAKHGLSVPELKARVNMADGRLEKALKLLSVESPPPVAFEQKTKTWYRTSKPAPGPEFWERVERLTDLRHREREEMRRYVALPFGSHMRFLVETLGGEAHDVPPPPGDPLPADPPCRLVVEAEEFLRGRYLPIEPRKKWPTPGLEHYGVWGNIAEEYRFREGRALCRWGGAGWGRLVRAGKYGDDRFADELVEACARMYEKWNPHPAPRWVTCVPSLRRPRLVPDFARRLAELLGLPFDPIIRKLRDTPEQKKMLNSVQQARNLDGALGLVHSPPGSPVLLVDDMVDSRWTLAVAAWLLQSHGSGPVWPLVLADAGRS